MDKIGKKDAKSKYYGAFWMEFDTLWDVVKDISKHFEFEKSEKRC